MLFLIIYPSPSGRRRKRTSTIAKTGSIIFLFGGPVGQVCFRPAMGNEKAVLLDSRPGREGKGADATNTFSGTAVASSVGKS